jgi:predicted nucleic acid-binding protein
VRRIVSNTGPLISLEKLHQGYDFIRRLYDRVIIAPAVLAEVAVGQCTTPEDYLQHYAISDLIEVRMVSQPQELPEVERLHEGETQAIQLALELQLPLLIEETVGRRVAQGVGIQISGIAGQIIKAYRQGIISATEAQDKLNELLQAGRINRKIYEALLAALSKV